MNRVMGKVVFVSLCLLVASTLQAAMLVSDSFESGPYGGALNGVALNNAYGGTTTATWSDYSSADSWYTQSGASGSVQQAYASHHVALANVALNTSSTWQMDVRVMTRAWDTENNYESGVFLLRNLSDKAYWSNDGVMIRIFTGANNWKAIWVLGAGGAADIFYADLNPGDSDSYGYVPLSVVWSGAGTVASPLSMDIYANGNYKGGVTGVTSILGGGSLAGIGGGNAGWFDDFKLSQVPEPMTLILLGIGGTALLRRRV